MDWRKLLKERALVVSDGAWGTEFARHGLGDAPAPELWNLEQPDAVEAVARGYVEAGSDIILTNTFGGSRLKLERAGLAERAAELNRAGVEISKRAAGDRALVLASIGPTGELLAPLGERTEEEFVACFREQAEALALAGADGLVLETMADLGEAKAALRAAREARALPVVACMTFERGAQGFATMMGVTPTDAARELDAAGADLIGANCGSGIADMAEVARALRAATKRPLWIKPNAGVPELVDGRTVFRESPAEMAARVHELAEAGANVIGGCCGTTPEHIRCIAEAARGAREAARAASAGVLAAL